LLDLIYIKSYVRYRNECLWWLKPYTPSKELSHFSPLANNREWSCTYVTLQATHVVDLSPCVVLLLLLCERSQAANPA
jgi:hypothetical protein